MTRYKALNNLIFSVFAVLSTPAQAMPAPHLPITNMNALPQPLPLPYDERADANAQVAAAKASAKAHHKLLLIDLGGNWCPDCRALAGVMQLPELSRFMAAHYVSVSVDIGQMDKNLQIPRHYGMRRLAGVPAVLIIDPQTDRLVNAGHIFALSDARYMTPQALADWLASWL
jgi:thiol-disulfide isomerase/thioredoxin